MFTGGIGQIDDRHTAKADPERGMLHRAGRRPRLPRSASAAARPRACSRARTSAELDFNAVQRGDAEMEQKMNRVIRACNEMGDGNPDRGHPRPGRRRAGQRPQGARRARPAGSIEIRRHPRSATRRCRVLEIWVAEYQERNGAAAARREHAAASQAICEREKVGCEDLGRGHRRRPVRGPRLSATARRRWTSTWPRCSATSRRRPSRIRAYEPALAPLRLPAGLTRARRARAGAAAARGRLEALPDEQGGPQRDRPDRAPAVLRAAAAHGRGRGGHRPEPLRHERGRDRDRRAADQGARARPGGGGAAWPWARR